MRDCIVKFTMVMRFMKQNFKSELEQFVDNLTMPQFKTKRLFETLFIKHTIKYKNPKSGVEHEMLTRASDFFSYPLT